VITVLVPVVNFNAFDDHLPTQFMGDSAVSGDVVNSWSHATDPVGSHIDVPYSDIQVIEVARSSAGKNTLLVVGGVAVAIAIAVAVATDGGQHSPGFSR